MKKCFMLAGVLVIFAGIIFSLAACSSFCDRPKEKITDITEDFDGINVLVDTADVNLILSNDEKCKVVVLDREKIRYDVSTDDGVLNINSVDERKWYERIFSYGGASLTVYLPKSEYDSLIIDASTGDITVPEGFKFGCVDINLSTGDTRFCASADDSVKIEGGTGDVTVGVGACGSLEVRVSTGKTTLKGVNVSGKINIECSTGDTELTDIFCNSLNSIGDTGDFYTNNLTAGENVSIQRSTGEIEVNKAECKANISLETSTGSITVYDISCADLNINATTGDSEISDVNCINFNSLADTGDIDMAYLNATGKITIERSTGDVEFDRCDASELEIKTSTGSVKGTLLSEKVFVTKTSNGRIEVPETTTGGKCKITTSTGNIRIEIAE